MEPEHSADEADESQEEIAEDILPVLPEIATALELGGNVTLRRILSARSTIINRLIRIYATRKVQWSEEGSEKLTRVMVAIDESPEEESDADHCESYVEAVALF